MKRASISLAVYLTFVFCLAACSEKAAIEVENIFMHELPPGQSTGAIYMVLKNNTKQNLVLNYVHSGIASDVEVHRVLYENGMMQMRQVNHLTLDPGASLRFEPGGYHLMVMGIEKSPAVGETFELVMEFEDGYKITTPVEVRPRG